MESTNSYVFPCVQISQIVVWSSASIETMVLQIFPSSHPAWNYPVQIQSFHFYQGLVDSFLSFLVYVDDIIIAGTSPPLIDSLKQAISSTFKIRDQGSLKYFLGIEIEIFLLNFYVTTEIFSSFLRILVFWLANLPQFLWILVFHSPPLTVNHCLIILSTVASLTVYYTSLC